MNPTMQLTDISGRAMLVGLSISQFNPVKTDKKITEEVAQQHGNEVTMGRYAKSVIAKSACENIRKLASKIRVEYYRRTLPWSEDGARILTNTGYEDYAEFMRNSKGEWELCVDSFMQNWDSYVEDARAKLNGLFNPADYPTTAALRDKFAFRWTVRPVPVADDFRVTLGATEIEAIRQEISADLDATLQAAVQDVYRRMKEVVQAMVSRLRAYDPEKPKEAPFRDSLVNNISELIDILPSLNITQDANITRFIGEMYALTRVDAQTLRDNVFDRDETAKRAESILTQMSQFCA